MVGMIWLFVEMEGRRWWLIEDGTMADKRWLAGVGNPGPIVNPEWWWYWGWAATVSTPAIDLLPLLILPLWWLEYDSWLWFPAMMPGVAKHSTELGRSNAISFP